MKKLLLLGLFLVTIGCQNAKTNSIETVKDPISDETVPFVNSIGYTVIEHLYDSMDRGNHDYVGNLVVDSTYYNKNKFQRGEVIYYVTPNTGNKDIARVVGLPGEKIEIKNGQLFINDKRLESFYAKAMNVGISDFSTYKKRMKRNGNQIHDEKGWKDYFNRKLKPILIKENEVFVLADNSWRAWDSFIVGPLPKNNVLGKVLGIPLVDKEYVKTEAKLGMTQTAVTDKFGRDFNISSDAGVEIWVYDTTNNGFTYDQSFEVVAFNDIKNENVISQLFIYLF